MQYDVGSSGVDDVIESLNMLPGQVAVCTSRALNRTCEFVKTRISSELSAETRIKLKIIRDRLKIVRGNFKDNYRVIDANFSGILVRDLGRLRQTRHGVSADGKVYNPHSFIASLKGGRTGVYYRTTKKRFPVKSVRVPIFDKAISILKEVLDEETGRFFEKRFMHELQYMMRR